MDSKTYQAPKRY